jgi:hypothetical protein
MFRRDTLVTEDATYLINLIESPDNKSLEVQFQGNAEIKVLVESIMVGDKWVG